MKKGLKYFLILIAGINIVGVLYYFTLSPEELKKIEKEQQEKRALDSITESKAQLEANINADRSTEAFVFSQDAISEKLKSPASAQYPSITDQNVRIVRDKNKYTILSYVDSQNSYGALIRAKYICEMTYDVEKNLFRITKADLLE